MTPVERLNLPRRQRVRILNAFHHANVIHAEEVASKTERWWLMRRNLGRECVASIRAALAELGLRFVEAPLPTFLENEEGEAAAARLLGRCKDPVEVAKRIAKAYIPRSADVSTDVVAITFRTILLTFDEGQRTQILQDVDVCPRCGCDERAARDAGAFGRCPCDYGRVSPARKPQRGT